MGPHASCIVPLVGAASAGDGLVGGKAASLSSLMQAGFRVPRGFRITTRGYEQFIVEAGLSEYIAMELSRKPLDGMRWEELWDAALRIRSAFLRAGIPDRWTLERSSGALIEWRPGHRGSDDGRPLLGAQDLAHLLGVLGRIETLFGWPPDVEWTGGWPDTVVLQARPITTGRPAADDKRDWYLTLRPNLRRLSALADRVAGELIPALEAEGARLASHDLSACADAALAAALLERAESLRRWKDIYWDEFIPLAHGVRQLGRYYADAVRPDDPFEFVGLLKSVDMLASLRNQAMADLADRLRGNALLIQAVSDARVALAGADATMWRAMLEPLRERSGGPGFLDAFDAVAAGFMDVMYGAERLLDRPDLLLHTLLELANVVPREAGSAAAHQDVPRSELEQRLFDAIGPARRDEAVEVLRIGRVSWRLRGDDNLLLSRVESQLNRAVAIALDRLRAAGRLRQEPRRTADMVPALVAALTNPDAVLDLPAAITEDARVTIRSQDTPRQLVGQPASPGWASGRVCRVTAGEDIAKFRAGNVLVCDAIQPMMTHLVPLAVAVVERRGGMLIHGAIIAREMGIPCVNGIARAVEQLRDGDLVTVGGHLGIVTVGPPEFDLELA